MGNSYSDDYIARRRNTIEIVMADEVYDERQEDRIIHIKACRSANNNNSSYNSYDNSSCDSLISIISITSSTQTEPDFFTAWPMKQRHMFKWINKFKYYHHLLSRSQQILNFPDKPMKPVKSSQVRMISLSTQTINKISDSSDLIKRNIFIHKILKNASKYKIYNSNEFIQNSVYELSETTDNLNENELFINSNRLVVDDQLGSFSDETDMRYLAKKHSHRTKRPRLMSNESLLSHLTNNVLNNELKPNLPQTKLKPLPTSENHSSPSSSSDSLTCVTLLSKPEQSSLLYKSSAQSNQISLPTRCTQSYKDNLPYKNVNDFYKVGLQRWDRNYPKLRSSGQHKFKLRSRISYTSDECRTEISLTENQFNIKAPIIKYKFWISASRKNRDIFHSYGDRRIESIARLSDCQIELTNIVTRQSNGMLKQKVIIHAPNSMALEKCCKLFDDKFPEFYATSRMIRTMFLRNGTGGTFNVANEFRRFTRLDRNSKIRSRKRKYNRNNYVKKGLNQNNNLGFLKYAFDNS